MRKKNQNGNQFNMNDPKMPPMPFIDPDAESRKALPSEAPKFEEEIPVNITEKDVGGEFRIEIDTNEIDFQPPREFEQTSLNFRNKLKFLVVVFVVIVTVIAGAMILYDTLLNNRNARDNSTIGQEKSMSVSYSDSEIAIRSDWNSSKSIAYIAKTSSSSVGFELDKVFLCNRDEQRSSIPKPLEVLAELSKSVVPVTLHAPNYETVGINNGWDYAVKLTSKSHGLKQTDIGSVFCDGAKKNYTVVKIVDADNIIIYPSFDDYSKGKYQFAYPSTKKLDFVKGKSTVKAIEFQNAAREDLYPVFSKVTREITADSKSVDVSTPGYVMCSEFTVRISFDVLNVRYCLKYLESNAGSNSNSSFFSDKISEKYMTLTYVYTFSSNGSCTLKTEIEAKANVHISGVSGFSTPVKKYNNSQYVYIPNTKDYTALGATITQNVELVNENWSDELVPPYRFYAFNSGTFDKGICVGVCPDASDTEKDKRKTLINRAAKLDYENSFILPSAVSKDVTLKGGEKMEFVSFIVPFEKGSNNFSQDDFSAICWYCVNDDVYLMVDAHKALDKNVILPAYMNGMKVTVLDSAKGTTVDTKAITNKSVHVSVTSEYGYAVLKLTK